MLTLEKLISNYRNPDLINFLQKFDEEKNNYFSQKYHGDFEKWEAALRKLHQLFPIENEKNNFDISSDRIRISDKNNLNDDDAKEFTAALKQFMPWRKGPYEICGINIDTEWRSDWKWQRLQNHISDLSGRNVLDIGCGNGYHCWRMLASGAKSVLGIEPMLHFVMQFNVVKSFLPFDNIEILPLRIEDLPKNLKAFDTVFSMGVLYHRRSPIDHLYELKELTQNGGEVVLETLVIDGEKGATLVPDGRYAKMRNVWFIPSVLTLESWLKRCGYKNIRLVDVTKTSIEEQRVTEWMEFESLKEFLDPTDLNKTIEGYPAPKRAIFTCTT
ncbi:MAG: tRNA 5-methoxyuridine(34)/uridine 5-oxyacetic acid(34) synthase CmoB [Calditrichaeota bacterium]|nr:MAG: tRNA 5-methoxyuridine(34)/uridine 5-oxyacetic acid(34) synthase CmoB [Calditrichota bacterium]MBL1207878.1 tRNA 5-methoxyuridine(34)/uridine 5-oxyacetic acid(34) synthase CmoB [Calditrichota bacterium]NOG47713.1 tRNA 5-methoxyuridine(34)/uridine 5-oxyacetic acid(34) synthase CmoB [Calditrichota bacterium]